MPCKIKSGCLKYVLSMLNWRLCIRSPGEVERPLPSPEQKTVEVEAVGHSGFPVAGKIRGFQLLEKTGGCASIQRPARSVSVPWQLGTESCAWGGIPDSGQHQEEALRHGRGRSPFHRDRGPCLLAWPADGGLGKSWDH